MSSSEAVDEEYARNGGHTLCAGRGGGGCARRSREGDDQGLHIGLGAVVADLVLGLSFVGQRLSLRGGELEQIFVDPMARDVAQNSSVVDLLLTNRP